MIRHMVFFTLKDGVALESAKRELDRLGSIPAASVFEVRTNTKCDQIANDIDLVVYAEFPDRAALAAYKQHPTYAEVTSIVQPMRELRYAADVES